MSLMRGFLRIKPVTRRSRGLRSVRRQPPETFSLPLADSSSDSPRSPPWPAAGAALPGNACTGRILVQNFD